MSASGGQDGPRPPPPPDATATGIVPTDLPTGSLLAGRFRLDAVLGVGGMGVVYRATDEALGVPVAVKLLRGELAERPGAFERFRQELLLARQVSSPHVVRIHDIAQDGDRWLISMDLVDGEPLDRRLDRMGPLPVEEAVRIAREVALGLAAAHERGIVHRDLKTSNVLLDAAGRAYVSDFGIARSLGARGMTQTGAVVGTPDYLSPEQARAEPLDGRSDLYSLGLLLYEMLAGKPAYSDGTASESLSQRLVGPPPPIRRLRPDAPAWVERLLDRLLRPQPAHRLQDAHAVVAAIDQQSVPRDWRALRRATAAVAVLLLAGTAILAWWRSADLGEALAVPSPPDRLLVLPITNDTKDSALAPALEAVADSLLRQRAQARAVADAERLQQALAQLRLPDGGRAGKESAAALLAEAGGSALVRTRVSRTTSGYRVTGTLERAQDTPVALQGDGPELVLAMQAFDRKLAAALGDAPALDATLWSTQWAGLRAHGEALSLRRAGRMEDAVRRSQEAVDKAPGYAPAWLALSHSALQSGQLGLASQAAERGRRLRPPPRLAAEFTSAATLAGGPADAAVTALQSRLRQVPDDLDASLRLAQLQGQANQLAPAIATLRGVLARDGGDPRAWFLLGKFSILHGELRDAVDEHLVRALVLYKRGRNVFGEAETVNALGVAYSRLGQVDDAVEQYRKAVALRRGLGDRRGVASSLRNLAQLSTVQGRFDQAQAEFDEARLLFVALGDADGLAAVDNELGLLAEERGDHAGAEAAFRRVLRAREDAGDDYGVAESLNNLGYARFALGDYDSANAFWQQALAGFTRLEDPDGIVRTRQNLGALELARGRWSAARELLESSLAVAERQQMVEEAAVSRYYLAELEYAQGRLGAALEALDGAAALFASRKDRRGGYDVALLRARILRDAGDLPGASAAAAGVAAEASAEQRAAAALIRWRLARMRGDATAARTAASQALRDAEASGMRVMRLRAAIAQAPTAPLGEAARELGHFGLRLDWLAAAMRDHLDAGDTAEAARLYALALDALRGHEQALQAADLHALGAMALAGSDAAGARRAHAEADAARQRLRASLPAKLQTAFDARSAAVADAR